MSSPGLDHFATNDLLEHWRNLKAFCGLDGSHVSKSALALVAALCLHRLTPLFVASVH